MKRCESRGVEWGAARSVTWWEWRGLAGVRGEWLGAVRIVGRGSDRRVRSAPPGGGRIVGGEADRRSETGSPDAVRAAEYGVGG